MDPEPKGIRSVVLLLTVVVILSGVVGYFAWWLLFAHPKGPTAGLDSGTALLAVALHPVEFLPDTPPDMRQGIDRAIERLLAVPDSVPVSDSVLGVAAFGEPAIPRLLDALYRLDASDGFRSDAARRQALSLDRALRRIAAARKTVGVPPPIGAKAEPDGFLLDAKAWFQWWESFRPPTPSGGAAAPMGR